MENNPLQILRYCVFHWNTVLQPQNGILDYKSLFFIHLYHKKSTKNRLQSMIYNLCVLIPKLRSCNHHVFIQNPSLTFTSFPLVPHQSHQNVITLTLKCSIKLKVIPFYFYDFYHLKVIECFALSAILQTKWNTLRDYNN